MERFRWITFGLFVIVFIAWEFLDALDDRHGPFVLIVAICLLVVAIGAGALERRSDKP